MVFWIIWFIMGTSVLLLFTGFILPRIMLRTHAATLPVRDKAIDRLDGEHASTLTYSPADSVRPYIKRYTVTKDDAGVYFRGEWATLTAYAEYELTVYDSESKIIDIIRVKEKFNRGRYTHVTRLPQTTDYVTLRLLCINDSPILAEPQPYRKAYGLWLSALCFCLALIVDLLVWLVLTFMLRCFDGFTMAYNLSGGTWAAILCCTALFVILITCAVSLGGFFLRRKGYLHEKQQ